MNIWKDPYPEDISQVVRKANDIAINLRNQISESPLLQDLFMPRNAKLYRKDDFFDLLNVKPNVKHNNAKNNNELSGLYVFADQEDFTIVYTGISNTIARRMKQHGWGTGHNQSSLAYLMAKHENDHIGLRSSMKSELLRQYQERIRTLKVAVYPINNPYELHFLEVAIAGILKTKWNSFKTH